METDHSHLIIFFLICPLATALKEDSDTLAIIDEIGDNHDDVLLEELLQRKVHYEKGASKRLTTFLLEKHEPHAPPDGMVLINFEMELFRILEVNEVEQHLKVAVFVQMIWQDETLSWDPDNFGGILETWIPLDKVWLPDVIIVNMVEHSDVVADKRTTVEILANGTVVYTYPAVYTVLCDMDTARFPIDTQECLLEIASWGYPIEKLHLVPETAHSLDHYTTNEEWDLDQFNVSQDFYQHEGITVSELRYAMVISRKPLYYAINLVIPGIIICIISVFGLFATFSASGEREERYTFGLTSVLTLAVLALIVSGKVPHSSESVPLLIVFFLWQMIIITIATFTTSLIMKLATNGVFHKPPPPKWVCVLFRLSVPDKQDHHAAYMEEFRKCSHEVANLGMVVQFEEGPADLDSMIAGRTLKAKHLLRQTSKSLAKVATALEPIMHEMKELNQLVEHQSFQDKGEVVWYQLADRLEILLMIIFLVLALFPSIWLLLQGNIFGDYKLRGH